MNINKSSWHYKLIKHFNCGWDIPDSLCPYVRAVLMYMVVCVFMACAAAALGIVFIWGPIQTWLGWAGLMVLTEHQYVAGIVVHTIYALGLTSWAVKKFYIDRPSSKPQPPKEPSIFMEYIKAKKHRFCPTLTFK